ncbi:hypothetical protein CYY_002142 [Polysphondylium violaceum]|uniref:Transmembrane protein n=1 Tax=Polysphondylium violaceum TaxID=133409 RepID=A0A8J4V354_9MYCE|nr:hypothetical protein CYY_002142 [Polysphondylium violaceum]
MAMLIGVIISVSSYWYRIEQVIQNSNDTVTLYGWTYFKEEDTFGNGFGSNLEKSYESLGYKNIETTFIVSLVFISMGGLCCLVSIVLQCVNFKYNQDKIDVASSVLFIFATFCLLVSSAQFLNINNSFNRDLPFCKQNSTNSGVESMKFCQTFDGKVYGFKKTLWIWGAVFGWKMCSISFLLGFAATILILKTSNFSDSLFKVLDENSSQVFTMAISILFILFCTCLMTPFYYKLPLEY